MKKMFLRKTGWILLTAFLLVINSFPVRSCAEQGADSFLVPQRRIPEENFAMDEPEPAENDSRTGEKKALTVMVYMCGSDLESDYAAATNDITEIACSGFDTDKVQVLVMTGGSRAWYIPDVPANRKSVWEIRPDILEQLFTEVNPRNWDEFAPLLRKSMIPAVSDNLSSMGAPQTLSEFLEFAYTGYPADRFALILWDHGGGPNFGICVDRLFNNDSISTDELKTSLASSPFAQEKLEWIGFDACLMASAEVAEQIAPYAKYMIGSEESEPGCGWDYSFLETIDEDADGLATGKRIIDAYMEAVDEIMKASGNSTRIISTLSCVDLGKMDKLRDACEQAFRVLNDRLTEEEFAGFAKARRGSAGFGRAASANVVDMDLVDLLDYAEHSGIEDEAVTALKEAIGDAIVYSRSNIEGACGLTVYFPYYSAGIFTRLEQEYRGISLSESYYDYIMHFNKIQTGSAQASFGGISTGMPALGHRDVRTLLNVTLTPEQMNALTEAHLLVFEKDGAEGGYALVSYVPDVKTEGNTLTAEYVHRALFITDIDGNRISPALPYTALADGRYTAEAVLVRNDDAGNEVCRRKALLFLTMNDKNGAVTVGDIYGYDDYTGSYLPRLSMNLEDFDRIEFTRSLRIPKEFSNGTLCAWDEWEETDQEVYTMSLKDEHLMMLHNQLAWETLNAGFLLCDYQNNRYISALITLEESGSSAEDAILVQYDDLETVMMTGVQLKIRENGAKSKANLSMEVRNLTDLEAVFVLKNLKINGEETELTAEVNGTGDHEGLRPEESQTLMLSIPGDILGKYDAITSITFDLAAENAASREGIRDIPVTITLNRDLSFMK